MRTDRHRLSPAAPRRRCNPHTGAVWGSYSGELAGFTVTPSYNLAKRAGSLAVLRKLRGGQTLRGVYTPADRLAVLELANKPFKARAVCLPGPRGPETTRAARCRRGALLVRSSRLTA